MREFFASSSYFGICLSIAAYLLAVWLKKKVGSSFFNPLLISIIITIGTVLFFKVDYADYNSSAKYLSFLLTPATICLAVPLYEQLDKLKSNFVAIMAGIFSGVLTSISSIFLMCKIFSFSKEEFVTFLPKSITTAIGMSVSEELGGYVPLTVAAIIITGVLGNIICESLLKLTGIRNRIAKGVAIGTSAHAIGTSKALEIGELEGAMSSLSIVTAGIITVVLAELFVSFY
ncbi:MAG: LrgB family protein [Erysipelotrichaceae bacterium]|nr:LrgB family protein [Erysipelotrichaceae bacterium]MBQ2582892.1 LrgB family protein [Erysipelotrichaceae bacterium]MBQ5444319.1 LrgB family protein [Erysipelotrichaceae bacterium]